MLNNYMAMVLIQEKNQAMSTLTQERTLSVIHAGGRYRIIDFALSNLSNAGVKNIGIFTESKWLAALYNHIKSGDVWGLGSKKDGISYFTHSFNNGQLIDVRNLENNLSYFTQSTQENIIVIDPDMIYKIDFKAVANEHEKNGNDITVIYKTVSEDLKKFKNCDSIFLNEDGIVEAYGKGFFQEGQPENVSLGCYVIKKDVFLKLILESGRNKRYFSIDELVSKRKEEFKIQGYEYNGYLRSIDSIKNYFDFNMDLLNEDIKNEIFFEHGRIYTRVKDTPPTVYGDDVVAKNSLLANGCIIEGSVKNSIIGRRVIIEEGAVVENCIICQGSTIKKGAELKNLIVTRRNTIEENQQLMGSLNNPLVIEKGDNI